MAQAEFTVGQFIRMNGSDRVHKIVEVKPRKRQMRIGNAWIDFDEVDLASEDEYDAQSREDERKFRALMIDRAMGDIDRGIEDVVKDLRQMADRIEREHEDWKRQRQDAEARYVREPIYQISEIQHTVLWGLANLNLDRLVRAGADLEKAKRDLVEI